MASSYPHLLQDEEPLNWFDDIEYRMADPAYAGYKVRLDQFRSTRTPEWHSRFSHV